MNCALLVVPHHFFVGWVRPQAERTHTFLWSIMKLATGTLAALLLAAVTHYGASFQPPVVSSWGLKTPTGQFGSGGNNLALLATSTTSKDDATSSSPCAMPDGVIPEGVTAKALRSALLTNANGELISLNDKMGPGTSIVVFLRHLG